MKTITKLLILSLCFSSYARTFHKDELQIELSDIKAIIKSSKTKHQDSYLFIAKVEKFLKANKNESSKNELESLAPVNSYIEVLLPKSACYEEALRAFTNPNVKLNILNMKLKMIKPSNNSKDYDNFAIIEVQDIGERSIPGCKLFR